MKIQPWSPHVDQIKGRGPGLSAVISPLLYSQSTHHSPIVDFSILVQCIPLSMVQSVVYCLDLWVYPQHLG